MNKKIWLLSFVLPILLFSGENGLQSKIARLQSAPKSERFKLMNEIKHELARMNEQQRGVALGKLRASLHGNSKKEHQKDGKRKHSTNMMHTQEHNGNILHRQDMIKHQQRPSPIRGGSDHRPVPQNHPGQGKHLPSHGR